MTRLYHQVPKDMQGDVLYPLNQLQDIYPEICKEKFAKCNNRPHIPKQKIPILNCLWNDVLHLSPIHPERLQRAFTNLGKEYHFRSYEIDPRSLPEENTVIYLYPERKRTDDLNPEDFIPYDPQLVAKSGNIPDVTLEYYKERIAAGEPPLLYHRIPHVLYRGSLEVARLPIVPS